MHRFSNYTSVVETVKNYRDRLVKNYSYRFVLLLLCNYLLVKGFLASAIGLSLLPFFKNKLNLSETTYQIYILIVWLPWSIKASMGSISDLYPLWGFHKKWYMILSSAVGAAALLLLGLVRFEGANKIMAPFLMFFLMMQVSIIDLLCEATYAKQMKTKTKEQGGDAVSFVWICVVTGSFAAATFVGVFTDYFNPQYVYLVCFPLSVQIVYPVFKNYLGEEKVPALRRAFNFQKLKDNIKLFILSFSMVVLALGMAFVTLFAGNHTVLLYAIVVSLMLCLLSLLSQERSKAKCNIYLFLIEASYIQIPGPMDYWYTADSSCVPGGPSFDMTYYLTFTNMVGSVASIVGIFIFQAKMSSWSFRSAFLVSSLIRLFASLFDIFIVSRMNIRLGIPDKLAYMFGDALIMNTASMLASMPAVILTAVIVNEGLESTTYAIQAGFQNFGQNVSRAIGVSMTGYFGIDADVRPCKFQNLTWLIFICHFVFPLLPICLLRLLIDDVESSKAGAQPVYSPVTAETLDEVVSADEIGVSAEVSSAEEAEAILFSGRREGILL